MGTARLQNLRTHPRKHAAVLECQVKAGETPVKSAPARQRVRTLPITETHTCKETLTYWVCVLLNGIHNFPHLMSPEAHRLLCRNVGYQQGPDDHPKGTCVNNTESSPSCYSGGK